VFRFAVLTIQALRRCRLDEGEESDGEEQAYLDQREPSSGCFRDESCACVSKDSFYLRPGDAGKPFQKIIDRSPILKVLKQCTHWDTSSFENPCPAHHARVTLDRGALIPVDIHRNTITRIKAILKFYAKSSDLLSVERPDLPRLQRIEKSTTFSR